MKKKPVFKQTKKEKFLSLPKRIIGTPCKYQCEKHMRQ